jgi:hypothetical protein
MGISVAGTPSSTKSASFQLVTKSMIAAPAIMRALRTNIDTPKPMTCWSRVVSLVSREITSPVRVRSKNAGSRPRMWSNTARRRSVTTRSPVVIIR